jgi:hypothetical protein
VSDPVSSLLVAFAPVWVFRLDFLIVNQAARDNRSDNTTERRNEKATAPSRFSTLQCVHILKFCSRKQSTSWLFPELK